MENGWKCPGCETVYSPSVTECPKCAPKEEPLRKAVGVASAAALSRTLSLEASGETGYPDYEMEWLLAER